MKISVSLFVFVVVILNISCGNISKRLEIIELIEDTKSIRDAQIRYYSRFHGYGSLEDLIEANLISPEFLKNERNGYIFNLEYSNDRYSLRVEPRNQQADDSSYGIERLTLFVNNTGVIRVSVDPMRPADSTSDPISPK